MEAIEEGVVVRGRVEIDTRQPFRSVKEAVALFGEKVLAGEIYGNKLMEMQSKKDEKQCPPKARVVTSELQETKQHLEKEKEEGNKMAHYLQSLQRELENTKRELQQLKSRKYEKQQIINPETEELKFVENEVHFELQKKRSVKFARPPSLTRVIVSPNIVEDLKTSPNTPSQKTKRKSLFPMIGGLFSKKKGNKESERVKSQNSI